MTGHLLGCLTVAGLALTGCEKSPASASRDAATHGAAPGPQRPAHDVEATGHPRQEDDVEAAGHSPHEHGAAAAGHEHSGAAPRKLEAELHTTPSPPRAGAPTALAFFVKDASGAVVRELALTHEKPMHLLAVSRDLATFEHLHPEPSADGAYRVSTRFPSGGEYALFADYTPEGSPQVVQRFGLRVAGEARAPVKLVESRDATQEVDGLRLTLRSGDTLRAGGAGAVLRFDVADARTGKPARDLEPYLGAMAHFVLISEDTQSLLHAHPLEAVGAGVSTVSAHTRFPSAGLYKVWVQLQRRGQVVTVPYVLRVQEPARKAQAPQAAHAGHAH